MRIENKRYGGKPGAGRPLTIAACAPASFGFVGKHHEKATIRMIEGRETDSSSISAHVERFLSHHERMLRRAGGASADLAVLPEDILRLGGLIREHHRAAFCREAVARALDRTLERMGAVCRQFKMGIILGTATYRRNSFYNTAMILDRAGNIVACYDKTHLPETEKGTYEPGSSLPVFETPFGRIGLLICWDMAFPEPFGILAMKGAELVAHPTFGHWDEADEITVRVRARDWSVPAAVGMWGGCAAVIAADGGVAARTGRVGDSMAIAAIDLAARRKWLWMEDVRTEKLRGRRPSLYIEHIQGEKECGTIVPSH